MMQGSLAEKLRVLRARMGLSLTEAAGRAGVTRDTLSDLEHGKRHPYMPTLSKIAGGYGVPVEELLEESVITFPPGAVEEVLAAHRAGKLGKRDAQKAIADLARSGPGDPLDNAVELLLEYAESKRSRDREGAGA